MQDPGLPASVGTDQYGNGLPLVDGALQVEGEVPQAAVVGQPQLQQLHRIPLSRTGTYEHRAVA